MRSIVSVLCVLLLSGLAPLQAATAPVVLVTGSNRGLGLEFVKQYAGKGWTVIATVRDPSTAPELAALAAQLTGLYHKDGGPVTMVQARSTVRRCFNQK